MKKFIGLLTTAITVLFALTGFAGEQYTQKGYAVDGYDTVAYFTVGKPVKGDKAIDADWNGAKWLFSSEENKQLFLAAPEKYAPQYDGHCAYAAANNAKAKAIPEAWHIADGKLYLNFSKGVQRKWLPNKAEFIVKADNNWPELAKEPAARSGLF